MIKIQSKEGKAGGCIGIFFSIVLIIICSIFIIVLSGEIFGRLQYGVKDIYDFQANEINKNHYATMKPVKVYDCIYATYSTDSETGETHVNAYYYVVKYKENETLIVKTKPNTDFEYIMDKMLDETSGDTALGTIEGRFVGLNYAVRDEYDVWLDEYGYLYEDLPENVSVCNYILDCSEKFSTTLTIFIICCVLVLGTIIFWVAFIITAAKGGKNKLLPLTPGTSFIPELTNTTPTQGSTFNKGINTFENYGESNASDIRSGNVKSFNPYDSNK